MWMPSPKGCRREHDGKARPLSSLEDASGENLTKGRPIHIEGRLKFEQWEQEDGQRRSKIRVVVEQFRFVDAKPGSGKAGNGKQAGRNNMPAKRNGTGRNNRPPRSNVIEGELVGAGQEIPI